PLLLADAERSQQASLITEPVIEADEHGVRAAWRGRNEVKIVAGTGQIGQRNESKQLRRRGINAGDGVAGDRQMRDGIEELRSSWEKIPCPSSQRGHCEKHVVGARSAAAAVIAEKKCLGPAVVDVRNIERAADGEPESVAVVIGLFFRLAVEGI